MKSPVGALVLLSLFLAARTARADGGASPQIWLGGEDPVVQGDKHKDQPADYLDLFKPGAPWPTAQSGLAAFKISTQLVMRGTDEQLQTVIDGLKARHIPLAIEMGLVPMGGPEDCGFATEGYSKPLIPEFVAKRILKLGGRIDYVAMDEPVWYGHITDQGHGHPTCRYSIPELVDLIAPRIAVLRKYFPDIQVGDIDPVNSRRGGPGSIDDIMAFVDQLRQKTGTAPAFVHADVMWKADGWQPLLEDLAARLHREGIPVGVICDGDTDAGSNEDWVSQALQRGQTCVEDPQIKPDTLIVQSWEPLPTRMMPETDPGSLTYEVKQIMGWFQPAGN